jgi:hypothetical protein
MAVGGDAALSHNSAAALHDLINERGERVHVTASRHVGVEPGIVSHRTLSLPADHVVAVDGIRCTSVPRTLLDLAAAAPRRVLERALGKAQILRVYDRVALEDIVKAYRGRRGVAVLRGLLTRDDLVHTQTASSNEELFLAICDRAGLPRPLVNAPFTLPDGSEIYIDAYWPQHRLAVEIDSERYHATPAAQDADRRRDVQLAVAGILPVRFSEADLRLSPQIVARTMRHLVPALAA